MVCGEVCAKYCNTSVWPGQQLSVFTDENILLGMLQKNYECIVEKK